MDQLTEEHVESAEREDVSKSGKPFMPPAAPRAAPPTQAQNDWLQKNKGHVRMSHVGHFAKFTQRGTLWPDGSFAPEQLGRPIYDGNGAFGVGVPVVMKRR